MGNVAINRITLDTRNTTGKIVKEFPVVYRSLLISSSIIPASELHIISTGNSSLFCECISIMSVLLFMSEGMPSDTPV